MEIKPTQCVISVPALEAAFIGGDEFAFNNGIPFSVPVRVDSSIARYLLSSNYSITKNGNVRFFQIYHIGFDVYEVKLRPLGKVNTYMVDEWEVQSYKANPTEVYGTTCR